MSSNAAVARKLKAVKPRQPRRTLEPGRAYRWAETNKWMAGPWCVAQSRTHFLTDRDGLCAFFKTEAEAIAAYAARKRR